MIITYWKGVFVVDRPEERGALRRAGFEPHEPSMCKKDGRCKACRAGIGNRFWSDKIEAATRLKSYCNERALTVMKKHLDKLARSRATNSNIVIPCPPGLAYLPFQKAGVAYMRDHKDTLLGDEMGVGKEQPLDAKLLTPQGWIAMGDVKHGDLIVGVDGCAYPVTGIFPRGTKPVYRVSFQDGSSTECGDEHLWEVNTPLRKWQKAPPKVLPLREIRKSLVGTKNGNRRHFIRLVAPVACFPANPHIIDPYVMGYLLGNGGLSQHSANVTIPDAETVERILSLLPEKLCLKLKAKDNDIDYIITRKDGNRNLDHPYLNELKRLGLLGHRTEEKWIPSEYSIDSLDNRVALLQGLMDADGSALGNNHGSLEFTSSSPQLAKDMQSLIWSLGGTTKIIPKTTTHLLSHRMTIRLPNDILPFRLKRKLSGRRLYTKYHPARSIKSVKLVGEKPCQCISVASPDNLYITDDFIVTHNTIQALGFINYLKPGNVLVVAPDTLSFNWRNESEKWLVDDREIIIPRSGQSVVPDRDNLLVIVNYEKLIRDSPLTRSLARVWDVLICDEAHALKTPNAQRTQAVLGENGLMQRSHRCLFLSGTPIENYPKEIWTIAAAICPAKFGNWLEFAHRYCGLHSQGGRTIDTGATHLGELQQRLRASFMIRRRRADVLKELPPKRRQLVVLGDSNIDWSQDPDFQRWKQLYDADYEARLAALEAAKTSVEYKNAIQALDDFIGVAFEDMSEFRHKTALAKLPACIAYIDDVLASGIDKLVIFAHHQDVLAQLAEHYGPQAVSLHGETKKIDRERAVKRFQEGDARIFIGGLKTAVGFNLFAASTAILVEVDWNPSIVSQAEDRLARMGQRKMVHIIHLVLDGTIDVNMSKRIIAKQDVLDKALNRLPEQDLKQKPEIPAQLKLAV